MARRNVVQLGRSRSRRLTSWEFGPIGTIAPVDTGTSRVFPTGAEATEDGLTLVRLFVSLSFITSTETSVSNSMAYTFGICLVFQNAAGIGVTAIPAPLTDIQWDGWIMHRQGLVYGGQAGAIQSLTHQIDSKAMRKWKRTDNLVAVIETVETGVSSFTSILQSRSLVKLP